MDYRYSSTNDGARDLEPEYRSIEGLTRWLVALLIASLVLEILGLVSSFLQLSLLSGSYTDEEATANDAREALVASGAAVALLVTIVLFAIWIVRAHRNLPPLGAERLDFTPGWALGWFFIPIAWLWKPYQAMRTLWQASHDAPRWHVEDVSYLLPLWWTFWLLSNIADQAVVRMTQTSGTIDGLVTLTHFSVVAGVLGVILYVLAILLVRGVARAQVAQHEARRANAASTQLESAGASALPG